MKTQHSQKNKKEKGVVIIISKDNLKQKNIQNSHYTEIHHKPLCSNNVGQKKKGQPKITVGNFDSCLPETELRSRQKIWKIYLRQN